MEAAVFFGANLRLARNFHARTLQEVAGALGVSRQYVYMLEAGKTSPKADFVERLAQDLQVFPEFFYEGAPPLVSEDQCHFRGNITARVSIRQVTLAKGEIFRRIVTLLDSKLRLPRFTFPEIEARSFADIEAAAERCRREWGLGLGPIDNMARVVENAGVVVTSFRHVSREIDAMSIYSNRPVMVANTEARSACRVRFDLGHEAGHFVIHVGKQTGDRVTETEANRFAGALLMPRASFSKEFPATRSGKMSWRHLGELKMRWKASKAAMLFRGKQLGLIGEDQYRSAVITLTRHGEARVEVEDQQIPMERPELFENAVKLACSHFSVTIEDLGREIGVREGMIDEFLPQGHRSADGGTSPSAPVIDMANYRLSQLGLRAQSTSSNSSGDESA
jgi:Zn-dependent peptidase ImmA (M78 family)/DNA-binding XRE family transcriptional regulator